MCCNLKFGLLVSQLFHKFFGGFSLLDEMDALVGMQLHHVTHVLLHVRLLIEGLLQLEADVLLPLALLLCIAKLLVRHLFANLKVVNWHLLALGSILQILKILLCGICRILSILRIALGIMVSGWTFPLVILQVEHRGDVAFDAGQSSVLLIRLLQEEVEVSVILGLQKFDDEILCICKRISEVVV